MATLKSRPKTNGAKNAADRARKEAEAQQLAAMAVPFCEERPKNVLEKALEAVTGDRADNYGDQLTNFTNIADRMTITLREKLIAPITPQEVALLMLDVKLARLVKTGGRHEDSIVDIAGYALCLEKVNEGSM